MIVKHLGVSGFRNLDETKDIELPGKGILVAAAPNAAGKTNFLESVAMLLRGKSWRAGQADCVTWGKDSFMVWGEVESGEGIQRVAVRYHKPVKKLRIEADGEPISVVSLYSRYPMILFLPEDTFLLSRGPAPRRNFLNQLLVVQPTYLSALVQYERSLRQRNMALKGASEPGDVRGWTELVAEHGVVLWRHREQAVQFISSHIREVYEELTGEDVRLEVDLMYGARQIEDLGGELERLFKREQMVGYTTAGPHRDDLSLLYNGKPVGVALSRGQVRSLVVALKVVAHRYVKQVTGEEPLLLLDDVFSELDVDWQRRLLRSLPETQVILTCTAVPKSLRQRSDMFLLDLRSIISQSKNKVNSEVKEVAESDRVEIKRKELVAGPARSVVV